MLHIKGGGGLQQTAFNLKLPKPLQIVPYGMKKNHVYPKLKIFAFYSVDSTYELCT